MPSFALAVMTLCAMIALPFAHWQEARLARAAAADPTTVAQVDLPPAAQVDRQADRQGPASPPRRRLKTGVPSDAD